MNVAAVGVDIWRISPVRPLPFYAEDFTRIYLQLTVEGKRKTTLKDVDGGWAKCAKVQRFRGERIQGNQKVALTRRSFSIQSILCEQTL